ncbi:MAG TPA: hypothetical protein VKQ36_09795 [Ktedonobacterales bacterium]|nr:hypothetical protein [Ktedonobacterales bacterium]
MRFSQFLRFLTLLPFLPRTRLHYFTDGIADGKSVAAHSGTTLSADSAQVGEQALFAAAALPGHVAPEDARNYQVGWIAGYRSVSDRAATPIRPTEK